MKLTRRWILGIFLTVLLSVILLLVVLGWGASTESGSQWMLRQVNAFIPGELDIKHIEGNLLSQLKVQDVRYQQAELDVTVETAELQWLPAALLGRRVHVEKLAVTGVEVHLPPADPNQPPSASEPTPLPDIQLPLAMQIDDLAISQVTIHPAGSPAIEITELQAKVDATDIATLEHFSVRAQLPSENIQLQAAAEGTFGLQTPHPIQAQLNWSAELPAQPTFTGNAEASGDLTQLAVQHELQHPVPLQLNGTLTDVVTAPHWDVQLDWQPFAYPFTDDGNPLVNLTAGYLTTVGSPEAYQLQLNTGVSGPQIPAGEWEVQATGNTAGLQIQHLNGTVLEGTVQADGAVNWQQALTADINLQTDNVVLTELWTSWSPDLSLDSELSAAWANNVVEIAQLTLNVPEMDTTLKLAGQMDLTDPSTPVFDNSVEWENLHYPLVPLDATATPLVQAAQGHLDFQGTLQDYQVQLTTALQGEQIPAGQWQASVQGSLTEATLQRLHGDILAGEVEATGKVAWVDNVVADVELSADQLVLTELWADWDTNLRLNGVVQAQLDDTELTIPQARFTLPKTNTQLTAQGQASLTDQPKFQLTTQWQNAQYPLLGAHPLAASRNGKLTVAGTAQDYTVQLTSQLQGKNIPQGTWRAKGRGNTQNFKLAGLHGDILGGNVDLVGQVAWQPAVTWQLQLNGDKLNPAKQWPGAAGRLALEVRSQGKLDAQQRLQADLDVKHLKGTLNNYPLLLTAKAKAAGDTYQLSALDLRSGRNRLTASGTLSKTLQADWTLKAPQLGRFLPDSGGVLNGEGTLSGTPTAPVIKAQLKGRSLKLADNALQRINAEIDANLQTGGKIAVDIEARQLQQQGKTVVDKLTVQGKGQVDNHQLVATLQTPQDDVALQLQGGFDAAKTTWQGMLEQLRLNTEVLGQWQLDKPSQLTASPQAVKLSDSCLVQQQARVCSELAWSPTRGSSFAGSVSQLPLSLANPMVTGNLNGQLGGTLTTRGQLQAEADLAVSPGTIKAVEYINAESIEHNGGTLQLTLNEHGLKSDLNLRLLDQSGVTGIFEMPGFNGMAFSDSQPVKGQFNVSFPDLSIVPSFVPDLAATQGSANANLTLSGTVGKPAIEGIVEIVNAQTEYPELGLKLSEINFKLTGDGSDKIRLQGRLKSGDGYLDIIGITRFATLTDWQANVQVFGDGVEVINIPDVWAKVSPDLTLAVKPRELEIKGTLTVPAAQITPSLISAAGGEGSAIPVSQDVVIISGDPTETSTVVDENAMQIRTRVQIILGDAIEVDTTGFKSRLGGSLWVDMEPPELMPVLNGQVNILDGTYRAFGQDLDIQQGNISYDGGAIDNPAIYLKAVRKVYNDPKVKSAGVVVSGSAQALQLNLISEPKVPDGEILSYIVTGRNALAQTQDGETAGGIRGFTLGTYIQPNLYVGYRISLFDESNVFTLRYEINKTWGIDAQIGQEDKGVGVSYTLEY